MDDPRFQVFKTYIYMGVELTNINPMYAYYMKSYGVQKAHQLYKTLPPKDANLNLLSKSINQWLGEVEKLKIQNPDKFTSREENQKELEQYVIKLFFDADDRERKGETSLELQRMFQVCSRFIDILSFFGQIQPTFIEKRSYCKYMSLQIYNRLNPRSAIGSQNRQPNIVNVKSSIRMQEEEPDIIQKVRFDDMIPEDEPCSRVQDSQIKSQRIHHLTDQPQQLPSFPRLSEMNQSKTANHQQTYQPTNNTNMNTSTPLYQQNRNIQVHQNSNNNPNQQQPQNMLLSFQPSRYYLVEDLHQKSKLYIQDALSELDFKQYPKSKDALFNALECLQKLEKEK